MGERFLGLPLGPVTPVTESQTSRRQGRDVSCYSITRYYYFLYKLPSLVLKLIHIQFVKMTHENYLEYW